MTEVASLPPRPPSRASMRSPSPQLPQSQLPRPSSRNGNPDQPPTPSGSSHRTSAPPSAFSALPDSSSTAPSSSTPSRRQSKRRSSYDTLVQISTSKEPSVDSYIPLPLPSARTASGTGGSLANEAIQEGVPLDTSTSSRTEYQNGLLEPRPLTPTRSLSRIPVSSVGNARTLAENDGSISPLPTPITPNTLVGDSSFDIGNTSIASSNGMGVNGTPSNPNAYKRMSLGGGGTTKVLGDLQTAALQARGALENTRQQLRQSQRSVGQLTRQVEDLKEGRERLRLENESLNNVVTRKERLLQEILERARKAEAELVTLKTQVKTEQTNAKKAQSTVSEAVTQNQKAQREYATLKESYEGLTGKWSADVKDLREEMRKRDEAWKTETTEMQVKYNALVKLTKATSAERTRLEALKADAVKVDSQFERTMREEIGTLTKEIHKAAADSELATTQSNDLAVELARLRRLMRAAGSTSRAHNIAEAVGP